jgi:hypothetical protein
MGRGVRTKASCFPQATAATGMQPQASPTEPKGVVLLKVVVVGGDGVVAHFIKSAANCSRPPANRVPPWRLRDALRALRLASMPSPRACRCLCLVCVWERGRPCPAGSSALCRALACVCVGGMAGPSDLRGLHGSRRRHAVGHGITIMIIK